MSWKPEYTLALLPIGGAVLVSVVFAMAGASAAASQWAAIITFLVLVPFCVGRLLDRGR